MGCVGYLAGVARNYFRFLDDFAISRADCSSFALFRSSPPGQVSLWPQFLQVRLLFASGICDRSQDNPNL